MVLLLAVLIGLAAGMIRARLKQRSLQAPQLQLVWLVPIAFLPQFLAFQLPLTARTASITQASFALVSSQALLLIFAWANRKQPGFWLLGLGLILNLAVITANGGLMPISPETVTRLIPDAPPGSWQTGNRLGTQKDLILPASSTRLVWLSDRFFFPEWIPILVAFSLGDIFIAAGSFWFFWSLGGDPSRQTMHIWS